MEAHRAAYCAATIDAKSAVTRGNYREAIRLALSSLEHVDGMIQYERKYGNIQIDNVESIEIILKFAPFILDYEALDDVDGLLKGQRRIDKHTSDNLAEKLTQAREQMWEAHRLWEHLERNPKTKQDELGQKADNSGLISDMWWQMGLIDRVVEGDSYRLSLITQMSDVVLAKCPSCGAVGKALKSNFLAEVTCPKCKAKVRFVIRCPS